MRSKLHRRRQFYRKTVLDEAKKEENRLFIKTSITGEFIKNYLQNIIFKKQGLGYVEISGPTCNYFLF